MGLVEQAAKFYKGKQVIIVTSLLDSEGYLQEIAGKLTDAIDGCLVVEQGAYSTADDREDAGPLKGPAIPTLVSADYVAWMYEETGEEEPDDEETY